MGREIKRVPLDFDWKLDETWAGYINPYSDHVHKCEHCDGIGYNPATMKLYHSFYDSDNNGVTWNYRFRDGRAYAIEGITTRWCDKLTQDEVDELAKEERLTHFGTHTWVEGKGWIAVDPMPQVPAEVVNAANAPGAPGMGHDALNMHILIRARAKRLGVYGHCPHCKGKGSVWESRAWEMLCDAWERIDPPTGEGWQVWQTVGEGSPITPVFATAEELIDHLVNIGTVWNQKYSREAATAFVKGGGWVPSAVIATTNDGKRVMLTNIDAALVMSPADGSPIGSGLAAAEEARDESIAMHERRG